MGDGAMKASDVPSRCEACDRGEVKFKPDPSGIFPKPLTMHRPSMFICMNEIADEHYEALLRGKAKRERGEGGAK
jgi:hypothetical protein